MPLEPSIHERLGALMALPRIMLADDHTILRAGLRMMLNAQPDMEVVGEAQDGRQAIEEAQKLQPDLVLMDITIQTLTVLKRQDRSNGSSPT